MNGYAYQAVFSNIFADNSVHTATSASVTLTVDSAPTVSSSPSNTTVDAGNNTTFTILTGNGYPDPTDVQWQVSTDGGATFTNLSNNNVYSNVTTQFLTITGASASMNGYEYQAVIGNAAFPDAATTQPATLTVDFAPSVSSTPSSTTIDAGSTATFTATASGNPTPTVQWQVKQNNGSGFIDVPVGGVYGNSGTSTTLTITGAMPAMNGYTYQAVFSNTFADNSVHSQTSSSATLTVDTAPTVTSPPLNITVDAGNNASFSVLVNDGNPDPTDVQWQVSTDGGATFTNLSNNNVYSNVTTSLLTISAASTSMNGYEYQAVIGNAAFPDSATTEPATLTVDYSPTITTNPVSVTVDANGNTSFTATASGNPTPTVQWQVNENNGSGFANVPVGGVYGNSGTSTILTITGATPAMNGYAYQAIFSNTFADNSVHSRASSSATLTVDSAPTVTSPPSNTTVDAGHNATFTAVVANGYPTITNVQWQVSTDGGATFTNLNDNAVYSNATSLTLSITGTTVSMNGCEYRAAIGNAALPNAAISEPAILTVAFPVVVTSNPVNTETLVGNNAIFTAAAVGSPAPTVQWEVSTDGGTTFTYLSNYGVYSNATTPTLDITGATLMMSGNEYRAIFTNTTPDEGTSTFTTSAALLTVKPLPFTLNPATLANWTVKTAGFKQTESTIGGIGPITYKVTSGTLPTGLSLNSSTGVISGKPTVAKTYNFIVLATDAIAETSYRIYSLTINPPVAISSAALSKWTVNQSGYSQTVSTNGGTGTYTFKVSSGTLPTGLTLNKSTGVISGKPTAAKTFRFTITATDSVGAAAAHTYSVTINPAMTVGNPTVSAWTEGKSGFTGTLTIGHGSPGYSIVGTPTGLPTGLTAVVSGSKISFTGTPTVSGTFNDCTIVIKDASGSEITKQFSLTINPAISFLLPSLPTYVLNETYSETVSVTGGTGAVKLQAKLSTALPSGIALQFSPSGNSFTISGKTSQSKTITITVKAIDSVGAETEMTYTLSNT
jgi:hypothetical protein